MQSNGLLNWAKKWKQFVEQVFTDGGKAKFNDNIEKNMKFMLASLE
jgi:hypothetical protein